MSILILDRIYLIKRYLHSHQFNFEIFIPILGTNEIMVSPAPSGGPELIAFLNALEHIKNKMGQDVFVKFPY